MAVSEHEATSVAIIKWGIDKQVDILTEECAELIQALSHFKRGRCKLQHVAEEIADVELTMGSVKRWIEVTAPGLVTKAKAKKLRRLRKLIKEDL